MSLSIGCFSRFKMFKETWIRNAILFEQLHGFPHAMGAIDGKHFWVKVCALVVVRFIFKHDFHFKRPGDTGDAFYNYKGHFSRVMLAVVDAEARFLMVDIGAADRNSGNYSIKKCA